MALSCNELTQPGLQNVSFNNIFSTELLLAEHAITIMGINELSKLSVERVKNDPSIQRVNPITVTPVLTKFLSGFTHFVKEKTEPRVQ